MLYSAPDFVNRRVGETDDVEVIDDEFGVGHLVGQRVGVGLVGVDHCVTDLLGAPGWLRRQPGLDRRCAAGTDHINELAPIQIDDPGHQQRRVCCGGGEPGGLIEPDRGGCTEPREVIDAGLAVIAHRVHGGGPCHPERPGRRRGLTPRQVRHGERSRLGPAR